MTGSVIRRGKKSWRLKFELGRDDKTGKRQTRYHTFQGTKREAEAELIRLMHSAKHGNYVDPSNLTVTAFFDRWERDWVESHLTPKSVERYQDIGRTHIRPHLGAIRLQKLTAAHVAEMYAKLLREGRRCVAKGQKAGLSHGTVRYIHRVLHRALGHAVLWNLISNNPAASVDVPKGPTREIEILTEDQVRDVLEKLRNRQMFQIALIGLATGMRRGEILALQWRDIDFDSGRLHVERTLEQTKKRALRFKPPKTKYGRRTITLPHSLIAELRALRRDQSAERLSLGLGKEAEDALVIRCSDGSALLPNSVTTEWRRLVQALKLPKVSLHAWRHTHASQLIASGMDILTISRRMGHGSPSITLNVYGHLFSNSDDRAASIIERSFGTVIGR